MFNKKIISIFVMVLLALSVFLPMLNAGGEETGLDSSEDVEENEEVTDRQNDGVIKEEKENTAERKLNRRINERKERNLFDREPSSEGEQIRERLRNTERNERKERHREIREEMENRIREGREKREDRNRESIERYEDGYDSSEETSGYGLYDTPIDSDITGDDVIWDEGGSPYWIEDDVTITGNLTIDPGVEVLFNGTYTLTVEGNLSAEGEEGNKIFFTSNATDPNPGDWDGIEFEPKEETRSTLDYVNVSYASTAITIDGISLDITNSEITLNDYGIYMRGDSSADLSYNDIYENDLYGVSIGGTSSADLTNNDIYKNDQHGIFMWDTSYAYLSYNDIYENENLGIYMRSDSSADLINNDIYENNYGIYMRDGSSAELIDNDIYDNSLYGILTREDSKAEFNVSDGGYSEVYNNSIEMNGNITVEDGGKLSMMNGTMEFWNANVMGKMEAISGSTTEVVSEDVTVEGMLWVNKTEWQIDSNSEGQHYINVTETGHMVIQDDSTITTTNQPYDFWVQDGGTLEVYNQSTIEHMGYYDFFADDPNYGPHSGLWINSDDVWMKDSFIQNTYNGIIMQSSSPVIENTTFRNYDRAGIYANESSAEIWESIFEGPVWWDSFGIYMINSDIFVSDTLIHGNYYGARIEDSTGARITGSYFRENWHGIYSTGSTAEIIDNSIINNAGHGIYIYGEDGSEITNNEIHGNDGHGIYQESSSGTGAGLKYSGDYDLVYLSYGFETINDEDDRDDVMNGTLNYFGEPDADEVLLVDDESNDYEEYYNDSLESIYGGGWNYWNTSTDGTPPSSTLVDHDTVIWFTGEETDTLNGSDQKNLMEFLDDGGSLFLSGQNIGKDIPDISSPVDIEEYCDVEGGYTDQDEYITNVNVKFGFNDVIDEDSVNDGGYADRTNIVSDPPLQPGETYEISVTMSTGGRENYASVVFDWDKDRDLTDENVIRIGHGDNDPQTVTTEITVPEDAETGSILMRVMQEYNGYHTEPCEDQYYGETEDYTVVVGDFYQDYIKADYQGRQDQVYNLEGSEGFEGVDPNIRPDREDGAEYGSWWYERIEPQDEAEIIYRYQHIDELEIYDNNVTDNNYGLGIEYADPVVYHNNFTGNNRGIGWQGYEINADIYENRIVENDGDGINFEADTDIHINSGNFYGNNISDNSGNGIRGYSGENTYLNLEDSGNTIEENDQDGIHLESEGYTDLELYEENMSNNGGDGLYVYSNDYIDSHFEYVNASDNGNGGINMNSQNDLHLDVYDSVASDNEGWDGIFAWSDSGNLTAYMDNVTLLGNDDTGLYIGAMNDLHLNMFDSVANENGNVGGIFAWSDSGNLTAYMDNVTASDNGDDSWGIFAWSDSGNLTAYMDNVTASDNGDSGIYLWAEQELDANFLDSEANENQDDYGIYIYSNSGNVTTGVTNVNASDNDAWGIYINTPENLTASLDNVTASENGEGGIHLSSWDNQLYITRFNEVTANGNDGDGVYLFSDEDMTVEMMSEVESNDNDENGIQVMGNGDVEISAQNLELVENSDTGLITSSEEDSDITVSETNSVWNGEGYEFVSGENMTLALEDSQALGNDNTGVYISSENDLDLIFTNNKVNGNGEGVWIVVDRKMDLEVNGNDISENEENGLIAQSGHTADVQIIDNTVIQNEGVGIGLIAGGITTPVNGTIENLRSEENQLGLVVIYGGDLTMTGSHLIENEDVGLAILDSLFLIEEYEDGEIIETRARPSIEGNVINKNGDPEGPSGYGVYVENSFVKIADNEINDNWNHGIRLETTGEEWAVTVEGNTIMHNSYGIYSSGSFAEVNNNEITYNRKQDDGAGIYLMDTELELLNNQIYNNLNYGIQIENDGGDLSHSRTDWTVTDEALVKNNPIMFRGNLDVESGSFTLENVNGFYMISQLNNRFGITVNSEFHSYNSNIQPHHDDEAEVDEYDASFTFEVEDSLFTMVDSSVSGAHSLRLEGSEAIIHGTDISQGLYGGIEAYNSNMVLERTNITGTSTFGLYLEESSATFSRLAIKDSEIGIEAHESEFFGRKSEFDDIPYVGIKSNGTVFEMHECIINPSEYPSYDDFIMSGDSTGELYDVEVGNNPPYEYEVIMNDNTRLDVFWSVRVNVTDIYMDPVPYDTVEVYDGDGNHVTNLTTDHNGLTEYEYLKDRTITPASDAEAEVTYEEPYEFVSEETENTQIEEIGFSRTVKIMPGKEPVFVSEPSEEVLLGESYHYNAESIDPRNRPAKNLTFALDRKPDGMTIDPETGQITWKPTASQVGNHTVIVRVRNQNTSRYAVQEFEVEVIHEAPRIYSVLPWDEASEVDVNTNLSIDVESDIYPTVVEFYLDGELVYRKTIYEDGTVETDSLDLDRGETYEWEVVVTDGEGETTTEEYTLNTVDEEEGGILPLYGWIALVIIVALILLLVAMEWRKRQEKETPPEEEEVFEEEEIEEEEMFEEEEEMPMEEEEMFEEEEEEEIFEEPEETEEEMFEEEEGVEEETPPPPEEEEEV